MFFGGRISTLFTQFAAQLLMTMRVISRLDDLADEAAAGTDLRRYLEQRGIKAVATLALLASSEAELDQKLVEPLLDQTQNKDGSMTPGPLRRGTMTRNIYAHRRLWKLGLANSRHQRATAGIAGWIHSSW